MYKKYPSVFKKVRGIVEESVTGVHRYIKKESKFLGGQRCTFIANRLERQPAPQAAADCLLWHSSRVPQLCGRSVEHFLLPLVSSSILYMFATASVCL